MIFTLLFARFQQNMPQQVHFTSLRWFHTHNKLQTRRAVKVLTAAHIEHYRSCRNGCCCCWYCCYAIHIHRNTPRSKENKHRPKHDSQTGSLELIPSEISINLITFILQCSSLLFRIRTDRVYTLRYLFIFFCWIISSTCFFYTCLCIRVWVWWNLIERYTHEFHRLFL